MTEPEKVDSEKEARHIMYLDGMRIDLGDPSDPIQNLVYDLILFVFLGIPLLFIWWLLA